MDKNKLTRRNTISNIKGNQTKAKPVRKNFGTIMSEMDPRDRKEMIKKGSLQKKPIKKMKKGGKA